jgi:hypothetical protein
VKHPFRRTVVFDNLGRNRVGERDARLRLYPRRGLVSVLAGGVGYQKNDDRSGPSRRSSDPKESKLR